MAIKRPFFSAIILAFSCLSLLPSCSATGGDGKQDPPVEEKLPVLTIADATTIMTKTASSLRFYVSMDKVSDKVVSVDYGFSNGTAVSPKDFQGNGGTLSIPAKQLSASIEVILNGDATDLRQPNLEFTVTLANPKNCTLGAASAKGTLITEDGSYLPTDNTGYTTPTTYPGYTLVWQDEFSGSSLDLSTWNQEVGNGNGGWGNNELEYYTSSTKNTFLSNGNLVIEARKESLLGFNYSSGRMTTRAKKQFTFGRIDIRAKLPVGKGIWPALWTLGANIGEVSWPACGEIDIMELIGTYPSRVYGTMHWKPVSGASINKGGSIDLPSGDFSKAFHVFSIIWEKDKISWLLDDNLYLTLTKADVGDANYPFNAPHFFIFNVAVGGNWPGPPDANTKFPQRMFVDYIRVFQ